jgi:D-arabinose 1-dehydrogenase-like Zn-dependent alcohol dehydrogenase
VAGTMRAARIHRVGEPVRVEAVPIPDVAAGEVLIRVLRAGLNRGDVHMRDGDFELDPGKHSNQLPILPMTIGHDGIGEVVEVGPGVKGVAVGDRVIARCILTCGNCKYCRGAREHLCIHHRVMGFFTLATEWGSEDEDIFRRYKDGMWAEYCRLPATNVERLQPADDVDKFSLVSQIAVGYRALKRARFGPGETVLVNGASGITGTGTVLAALAMGAAQVIAVARGPTRLARLERIDPQRIATISATAESIRERVVALTSGEGAQVLVDLTPSGVATTVECVHALEPGGRVALIGGNTELLAIGYRYLMIRSIEITSSTGRFAADYPELIELTRRGVLDVSHVRPQFFPLEQINEALDSMVARGGGDVPVWPMMRQE